MFERITRKPVSFASAFPVEGLGQEQPPGTYEVEMIEELIEGLSFPAYRLVSASVVLPLPGHGAHSYQLVRILPSLVRKAIEETVIPVEALHNGGRIDAEKST
jgi:hypothetical protein